MKTVAIIGSGMGALTTASLLAKEGYQVVVLEQNYLPGGCTSSYFRKGFIFEAGATTLVGLDPYMPLKYLLEQLDLQLDCIELDIPMRVHLNNNKVLTRFKDLDQWIAETERVFGKKGQRPFWEYVYKVSQYVWKTSLEQVVFPPSKLHDLWAMMKNFRFRQLRYANLAFSSTEQLLKRFGLWENELFVDFVNEQLLITAQNHASEVNGLFGATALCYTNYGNYYVYGGLIKLVQPICDYIKEKGGEVHLRTPVNEIIRQENGKYKIISPELTLEVDAVVSGIPINNTLELIKDEQIEKKFAKKLLGSTQLNSAFQMSIGFKRDPQQDYSCLHHQIHLDPVLPITKSNSIFISFSHPIDVYRCSLDQGVISVSTHVTDPENNIHFDKEVVENYILKVLDEKGILKQEQVLYYHSSTPRTWERWTGRKFGFVGGYPQFMQIKPWKMLDSRLDKKGMYICGDTTYPGQGIPGTCLSGIIAYRKMKQDGF